MISVADAQAALTILLTNPDATLAELKTLAANLSAEVYKTILYAGTVYGTFASG